MTKALSHQRTGHQHIDGASQLSLRFRPSQCTLYTRSIIQLHQIDIICRTFTCISVVPVAGNIVDDLSGGKGNKSGSILFVTIWELGEAAGPLLIAPLSEIYGRYPVYNAANVLFICAVAMSAWSQSVNLLIFARFLTGCAVASNVLNPAIIGDIFPEEQRGSAMSYVQLAPLLGGAIGPAVAGAIAQTTGWRMIMWMALALSIVCEIAFLMLFRETYKVVLLKKKKALLQPLDDDDETPLLKAVHETESALWASIVRPMSVFGSSFVLQMISLYGSFVFSFFYIISTTLPDILADGYGFSPSLVGSSFLTFSMSQYYPSYLSSSSVEFANSR
jgi:MFS family permease